MEPKEIRKIILARRLAEALSPYFASLELKASDDDFYILGKIAINDKYYFLDIPLNKTSRKIIYELHRLEPAIIGKKVKLEDVKMLLFGIYASRKLLYEFRTDIRRVTGLLADKKLQKYLIWKRITSKENRG
jgi:hypothetical protein